MHSRRTSLILAALLLSAGCAPRIFLENGPLDATTEAAAISIRAVRTENRIFRVYKVNGTLYALIPVLTSSSPVADEMNRALILSPAQRDSLVATATRISSAFDNRVAGERSIILFELIANATETLVSSSTMSTLGGIQTRGSAVAVNRILFRLQYADEGPSRLQSGQRIDFSFRQIRGSMNIQDLRALVRDLAK